MGTYTNKRDRKKLFKILFCGDFAPCCNDQATAADTLDIFTGLKEEITESQIAFINLEAPLCTADRPALKTGPNLKSHPGYAKVIAKAGFNVIGLANNHIMDYGAAGYRETISALKAENLKICGAGDDITKANKPLVVTRKGVKTAFIATAENEFSTATESAPGSAPLDIIDIAREIKDLRGTTDLIFVVIHGGNEYFPYPRPGLRKACRFFIECGADAVICHHPHVPGAYELHMGKPIVYSLGNFVFPHEHPPEGWNEGYALSLEYESVPGGASHSNIIPYRQSPETSRVIKMKGTDKADFLLKIESYRKVLTDEKQYKNAWDAFCEQRKPDMLAALFCPVCISGPEWTGKLSKILDPVKVCMPTPRSKALKRNLLTCESHLELLQHIIEKEFCKTAGS